MDLELELTIRVEQDIPSTTRLTTDSCDKKQVLFSFPCFKKITLFNDVHTKKASACNSQHTTTQL